MSLPHFHLVLYPTEKQTGSLPSPLVLFGSLLTHNTNGLSCVLSLSVAFLDFFYASYLSRNLFTQVLFYGACPLSFLVLPVCSLVSCHLQQTPARFQLCVQNDNKLKQPPACLSFLSKTLPASQPADSCCTLH